MTLQEFAASTRPCGCCGASGVTVQHNPNNNGLLVCCPHCGSKRPWGSLLYLKQNTRRQSRPPLPNGETLDSVWERFGNRCVLCSAPKDFLVRTGIGRQVHHVVPYAQAGHQGPLVPICAHCHEVANARQRVYWFMQRVVLNTSDAEDSTPVETSTVATPNRDPAA